MRLLSLWFPLLHLWYFVKQFLKCMMREKTILNKLLNFQKNNICAVGQRLHSPGNDHAVRILQSNIFYWLINKYKVCSDKSRTAYFGMWSSSRLDMAVRCGKPCSISIFSSVSSFTSPISISCMLTMFVWNLLVISMSKGTRSNKQFNEILQRLLLFVDYSILLSFTVLTLICDKV